MTTQTNIGLPGLLALLFIALKLCDIIAWSWWWVLSPLWIPAALALSAIAVFSIIGGILLTFRPARGNWRDAR